MGSVNWAYSTGSDRRVQMSRFSERQLRECIQKHLPRGEEVERLTRIRTGKFNTSYFVDTDRGAYVLRIAPPEDTVFLFYERNMMRQEPGIHRLVFAFGCPVRQDNPVGFPLVTGLDPVNPIHESLVCRHRLVP